MADAWILHAQEHIEASARQTALVKSAANTNTARANAERVQAAQEAKILQFLQPSHILLRLAGPLACAPRKPGQVGNEAAILVCVQCRG